ncbi:unnamed protein product [Paramecium sonneborni]|uniref:Uncharacterized protein n=1 Tax=Paramecium sonneborni TaxID=65129 RepID=A0A8S1QWI5_9CILI|nr:unnamed protein product [Paramecium sonneborni]
MQIQDIKISSKQITEYTFICSIYLVIIGNSKVDLHKLCENYIPTNGVYFKFKTLKVNNKGLKFQHSDTAGQERISNNMLIRKKLIQNYCNIKIVEVKNIYYLLISLKILEANQAYVQNEQKIKGQGCALKIATKLMAKRDQQVLDKKIKEHNKKVIIQNIKQLYSLQIEITDYSWLNQQ